MNKDKYFGDIVGQDNVKNKLSFYIDGFKTTSMVPHFLFVADKGCGKTEMAKRVAKNLTIDGKPKKAKELNCSTLKSMTQFTEQILLPFVQDNDVTLVFDEASELPRDITMSLLTMLNPNDNNRNTIITSDGGSIDINFKRHSFMFCTTEIHKLFHALKSRLTRVDLQPYKNNELMTIVKNNIKKNKHDISFDELSEKEIPTVLRGNPRCAQLLTSDIINYCSQFNIKLFDFSCWNKLKSVLDIKPLGLNNTEIQVLRALKDNPHCRLIDISSKIGLSSASIQRDIEIFLLKQNLIKVDSGRCLTQKGLEYLDDLDKC